MVYIGAVGLIGIPAMAVSFTVFAELLPVVRDTNAIEGANWFDSAVFLSAFCLSVLIGLQVAVEAAALQLGGIEALSQGPRWAVLLRHVGLSLVAVVFLGWAVLFGSRAVGLADQPETLVLGAVLVVVSFGVFVRAVSGFFEGYTERSTTDNRNESL